MKVLLVSLHFVEYAVELAKALSHDHEVHLVLSRFKVDQALQKDLNRSAGGKVSYSLLDQYSWKNPRIVKNFLFTRKLLNRFKPDLVHAQECANPSNLFFLATSLPRVCTVHDIRPHPGDRVNLLWRIASPFIRKYFYGKIIVHGEALKKELAQRLKRPSEDIFSIPHGCLFSFLQHGEKNLLREEDFSVLFFGRIQEYKGLRTLIEAEPLVSQKIPEFKVIIAGKGDDLALHEGALRGNPHFEIHHRFIPNEEVPAFFTRSALVVTPYSEASQSGIVAMAFAFGRPVVGTDVGSLSEMVEHGKTGLIVPSGDPEKLAEAIVSLLKNKEKRKKMGQEANRLAKTRFSWERIAHLTGEVYQKTKRSGRS